MVKAKHISGLWFDICTKKKFLTDKDEYATICLGTQQLLDLIAKCKMNKNDFKIIKCNYKGEEIC